MKRKVYISLLIVALALTFCLSGFFTKNRGKLNRLTNDKENELRQNWRNYTVYKTNWDRDTIAILFKIKDDKKILLPENWAEITTEAQMAESTIWQATNSVEIIGQNDVLFGYLIYRSADQVSILLRDENTIRLYYHVVRTYRD